MQERKEKHGDGTEFTTESAYFRVIIDGSLLSLTNC
jgi:hypothetical protein